MDDSYKTVAKFSKACFTEKKSEFIASIAPVKTEGEAAAFISGIRLTHKKARHNCYAYILRENGVSRRGDDGEPGKTAGTPIFEVLRKEGLFDVVCVVTRYFGGILLGASGLSRAYGKAAAEAVKAAGVCVMRKSRTLRVRPDYARYGRIAALIAERGGMVTGESFADTVEIIVTFPEEDADVFAEYSDIVEIIQKGYCNFGENVDFLKK
ncbi:MAG: YigZ family protein [Oscillospiraceae bacterium]|jgi:uncharacterized YigZ family protein|nr:YigZ family protein [Oscillospiraceae bacterium]